MVSKERANGVGGFPMTQSILKGCEFIDFEPTSGLAERAVERLGRIFGESPSDSSTRASLKKTRNGFEGRLQIRSAVGTFVADVMGEDPLQVLNSMTRKVRSQLRMWKRVRTLEMDAI
jgi:hypothetical protein